jgi:nicotinamidase-related amidase
MPVSQLDEKAALVVIDLQKGLVALPGLAAIDEGVERSARLAAAFRSRGLPVVLVNVTGGAPGRTETKRARMEPTPGWDELVPELERQPEDILVSKRRPGAFLGTTLHEDLQARGVTQLFLTGVATSNGVEATARSAFDLGYNLVFVTDAVADRDPEAHAYTLDRVFPRIGERATTQDVLALLG